MDNIGSNIVEKKAGLDLLAMLSKDVSKIAATAPGWSLTLLLEGFFWFCFKVFMYTVLRKIKEKAENSEFSFNFLVLERIAKLAI